MLLDMSALNQNNRRLSRLAIISNMWLQTKGNRLSWFLPKETFLSFFFFFCTCLFPFSPLFLHTAFFLQGCLLLESTQLHWLQAVLMLMEDVRREELMAWWAPNVQASLRDANCLWQVMRLLRWRRSEKAWLTGAVLADWIQGVCGSMWELPVPNRCV